MTSLMFMLELGVVVGTEVQPLLPMWATLPVYAVGPATGKAARLLGFMGELGCSLLIMVSGVYLHTVRVSYL